ncbi:transposase family protein [Streptomyces sp. JCM17656]|nr:transposase family protein [Streptomyces sp. JCM17656]
MVEHVSWLIYARRRELRSSWRELRCFKQALLTLAHLRKNETFAQVGAGFGISETTAWRYVDETVEVPAEWAPGLREALVRLGEGDFVILDGTLIPPTASRSTRFTRPAVTGPTCAAAALRS